ncbi:MAG: hypothetical protein IPF59_09475 [Ignavibacteria bacterium]|nr:hypothetical protein [Ignavibacteria bacterium]
MNGTCVVRGKGERCLPQRARTWRVSSSKLNALGAPTAYTIVPQTVTVPFLGPTALVRQRARFIEHQLYATRDTTRKNSTQQVTIRMSPIKITDCQCIRPMMIVSFDAMLFFGTRWVSRTLHVPKIGR